MTAEERARKMHSILVSAAKARSKPYVEWDAMPEEKRQRLIKAAERLEREYGTAGDPPSAGLPADEPVVEVS